MNSTTPHASDVRSGGFAGLLASDNITNLTAQDELSWPCELRLYWQTISPLVTLVDVLLSYGTAIIVALGLLLNAVSFYILFGKRLRKHSSNLILLALCVYDSCVLAFNFMIGVLRGQNPTTVNRAFQENEWLCVAHSVVVELFTLLSIWMVICLAVERLIVVSFPLRAARYCSNKQTKIMIAVVSLLMLAISCHKILVTGFEGDSVFGYKGCSTRRKKIPHAIFVYVAINTWLPTVTVVAINAAIARKIRQAGRIRRTLSVSASRPGKSASSSPYSPAELKLTSTMKAVCVTYLVLVLPLGVIQSVELYWNSSYKAEPSADPEEQNDYILYQKGKLLLKYLRATAFFFYQMNFAANFFIYYVQNNKFRSALRRVFPCVPESRFEDKSRLRQQISSSTSVTSVSAAVVTTGSHDRLERTVSFAPK